MLYGRLGREGRKGNSFWGLNQCFISWNDPLHTMSHSIIVHDFPSQGSVSTRSSGLATSNRLIKYVAQGLQRWIQKAALKIRQSRLCTAVCPKPRFKGRFPQHGLNSTIRVVITIRMHGRGQIRKATWYRLLYTLQLCISCV